MSNPHDRWSTVWSHREDLLRLARRRTVCHADAEDCVSEAMLRAAAYEQLDPDRTAAFLTAVTVRLCVDLHRDRARARRAAAFGVADERLAPPTEAVVCDRAEAAWLAARLTGVLTEREHEAVRTRAEDLAPVGVSPKATSTAMARARAKVRPLLVG